jgi:hypothetical protein
MRKLLKMDKKVEPLATFSSEMTFDDVYKHSVVLRVNLAKYERVTT